MFLINPVAVYGARRVCDKKLVLMNAVHIPPYPAVSHCGGRKIQRWRVERVFTCDRNTRLITAVCRVIALHYHFCWGGKDGLSVFRMNRAGERVCVYFNVAQCTVPQICGDTKPLLVVDWRGVFNGWCRYLESRSADGSYFMPISHFLADSKWLNLNE